MKLFIQSKTKKSKLISTLEIDTTGYDEDGINDVLFRKGILREEYPHVETDDSIYITNNELCNYLTSNHMDTLKSIDVYLPDYYHHMYYVVHKITGRYKEVNIDTFNRIVKKLNYIELTDDSEDDYIDYDESLMYDCMSCKRVVVLSNFDYNNFKKNGNKWLKSLKDKNVHEYDKENLTRVVNEYFDNEYSDSKSKEELKTELIKYIWDNIQIERDVWYDDLESN